MVAVSWATNVIPTKQNPFQVLFHHHYQLGHRTTVNPTLKSQGQIIVNISRTLRSCTKTSERQAEQMSACENGEACPGLNCVLQKEMLNFQSTPNP